MSRIASNKDIRTIDVSNLKARSIDGSNKHEISGYALLFNEPSLPMPFIEYIKPEALDNVDLSQTQLLYSHEFSNILARADSKSLSLKTDDKGLFFSAILADTTLANDVYNDILAGNIKGCSFGFTLPEDGSGEQWSYDTKGNRIHTITQIETLSEISLTSVPAYAETSVQVRRSLNNFIKKGADSLATEPNNQDKQQDQTQPDLSEVVADLQKQLDELKKQQKPADSEAPIEGEEDDRAVAGAKKPSTSFAEVKMPVAKKQKRDDYDINDSEVADDSSATDDTADTPVDENLENSAEDDKQALLKQVADLKDQIKKLQDKKQGDDKSMKNITPTNSAKNAEQRSFEAFLKGNKRDMSEGFTEADGGALIPVDVMDVMKAPEDPAQLSGYVTKTQVASPTAKLPVMKKSAARLASPEELEENPGIAKAQISQVNVDVKTYRGQLPISLEQVQDTPNIVPLLTQYVTDVKNQTEQHQIGAVLQTAKPVAASTLDDLKDAFNIGLTNYGSDRVWVVSESMYSEIDKLKDENGRYMVQDSVANATGLKFMGADLIIVADDVLGEAGEKHAFVGSLKNFVVEALRGNALSLDWVRNENFERILDSALRADFKAADTDAGKFITFNATTSTTTKKA